MLAGFKKLLAITQCLHCLCGPTDVENMNLDDYNIHVIASVFKQWLRDLPNPLMTFELYDEFIRVMGEWSHMPTIAVVQLNCT